MKKCIICQTVETSQWYTGPKCKSCYRKEHRELNKEKYKNRDKENYEKNKEHIKARQNEYYQNHKEQCKERSRDHYAKVGDQRRPGYFEEYYSNPENKKRRSERSIKWNMRNPEKRKKVEANWAKRNKEYRAYQTAMRRSRKLQATPKWLTFEQKEEIFKIYKNCPKGFHVDHIVPLQGKNVCGLHVPWNLQILPATENCKKGNKL